MDGFHAHLGVGLLEHGHDGPADSAELAPAVRPASARRMRPTLVLVRVVTCETLEEVLEGVV